MNNNACRRGLYGLAALLVTALAQPASAAETPRFWAKAGTTGAGMMTDLDACGVESRDVRANVRVDPVYAASGGIGGVIGAAIGAAIVQSIAEHGARAGYVRRCMHGHGYAHVAISVEDAAAFKALKTSPEKAVWAQAAYDKPDFPARMEASLKPPVPPLPLAKIEPLTYSGLRFDTAVLSPATGIVLKGGQVLGGKVAHRRTARVTAPFTTPGGAVGGAVPPGAIFYQVVLPGEDDPDQTYWCGQVSFNSLTGHHLWADCFYTDENGYASMFGMGQAWHISSLTPGARPMHFMNATTLVLEESDTDLIGPMDFGLYVTKIGKSAVTLTAKLSRDGKTETVWTGDAAFDSQGRAVLPFWSHRLVAVRSGEGVTVTFTPDGDGTAFDGVHGA